MELIVRKRFIMIAHVSSMEIRIKSGKELSIFLDINQISRKIETFKMRLNIKFILYDYFQTSTTISDVVNNEFINYAINENTFTIIILLTLSFYRNHIIYYIFAVIKHHILHIE